MKELDVRIVRLEPHAGGERVGLRRRTGVAGLAEDSRLGGAQRRARGPGRAGSGSTTPALRVGSPNYGYEQWVTVGPDAQGDGEVEIKEFGGGLYAVTRCDLGHITEVWRDLVAWRERSRYRPAHHQWLEESVSPPQTTAAVGANNAELDLYLPIAE